MLRIGTIHSLIYIAVVRGIILSKHSSTDMTTTQIQDLRNADVVVICSFSAGTYEVSESAQWHNLRLEQDFKAMM